MQKETGDIVQEYGEGMWKILQQNKPDDYVVSTGKTYSVKKIC